MHVMFISFSNSNNNNFNKIRKISFCTIKRPSIIINTHIKQNTLQWMCGYTIYIPVYNSNHHTNIKFLECLKLLVCVLYFYFNGLCIREILFPDMY